MRTRGPNDGRRSHPLYGTWVNVCYRTKPGTRDAARYADRGITTSERWQDFWTFVKDMEPLGPRPDGCSIDRIDNDGNYEPGYRLYRLQRKEELPGM